MSEVQALNPLERVLRDSCARALAPMPSLTLTLTWYRSVAGLARNLRDLHRDDGKSRGFPPDLIALLRAVHVHACERALDPSLPPDMVAGLHRHIVALGRAEHLAHPMPVKQKQIRKQPEKVTARPPAPQPKPAFSPRLDALLSGTAMPARAPAWMPLAPKGGTTVLHRN